MHDHRRDELVGRALSGKLDVEAKAEFGELLRTEPEFAEEFEALRTLERAMLVLGRTLGEAPALRLDSAAHERIRAAAGSRTRRMWFFSPWFASVGLMLVALAIMALAFPRTPRDGGVLFASTVAKNPTTRIGIWETSPGIVKACLWIAEEEWRALLATDRMALVAHLRAQVPAMRAAPETFAGVLPTDPIHARRVAAIAALRADTHVIIGLVRQGDAWVRSRILDEAL